MEESDVQLSIRELSRPDLCDVKMTCDDELHPKLNQFELLKHLNCSSSNLIVGVPKSGKSHLLQQLFKSKQCLSKVYHKIYVFRPAESGATVKKDIFSNLPPSQMYSQLTKDQLEDAVDEIRANASEDLTSCIIFDDMGAYLKKKEVQEKWREMMMNRRHLRLSVFFLCQTFYSMPRENRRLFSNLILFRVTKDTMKAVMQEYCEHGKGVEGQLCRLVYDRPHRFLFLNIESQQMFREWDRIVIKRKGHEEEEGEGAIEKTVPNTSEKKEKK